MLRDPSFCSRRVLVLGKGEEGRRPKAAAIKKEGDNSFSRLMTGMCEWGRGRICAEDEEIHKRKLLLAL